MSLDATADNHYIDPETTGASMTLRLLLVLCFALTSLAHADEERIAELRANVNAG